MLSYVTKLHLVSILCWQLRPLTSPDQMPFACGCTIWICTWHLVGCLVRARVHYFKEITRIPPIGLDLGSEGAVKKEMIANPLS